MIGRKEKSSKITSGAISKSVRCELAAWIYIAVISAVMILPFFIISVYSRPCADDFSYSAALYHYVNSGRWDILHLLKLALENDIHFYHTWQGLYSSAFILALQPGIFGEKVYFLGSWALILLSYLCVVYYLRSVLRIFSLDVRGTWIAALLLEGMILAGLPDVAEGLYWFNGAWNYMPFFFLTLLNVGCVINGCRTHKSHFALFSVALSFVISGGNHVTGFMNILLLAFGMLCWVYCRLRERNGVVGDNGRSVFAVTLILPLITAAGGFMIMIAAPGTRIRQNTLQEINPDVQSVRQTLTASFQNVFHFLWENINVQWLALVILTILYTRYLLRGRKENGKPEHNMLKISPIAAALILVVILCGQMCVPYYAMGNFGAGRVLNIFWLTFAFSSIFLAFYTTLWFRERNMRKKAAKGIRDSEHLSACEREFSGEVVCVVILCLLVLLFHGSDFWTVCSSLWVGQARLCAQQSDARLDYIMAAPEGSTVYVEPVAQTQLMMFDNPKEEWVVDAWYGYYGRWVVVRDSGE